MGISIAFVLIKTTLHYVELRKKTGSMNTPEGRSRNNMQNMFTTNPILKTLVCDALLFLACGNQQGHCPPLGKDPSRSHINLHAYTALVSQSWDITQVHCGEGGKKDFQSKAVT